MNKPMPAMRHSNEPESSKRIADSPVTAPTHDEIARRAYQLFEQRGREPGHEWEDWFRAERELL